jgi:tRNA(Arg) A34 adenosine deaminase TadA
MSNQVLNAADLQFLRRANVVARQAVESGGQPFGCVIVAQDGQTTVSERGNVNTMNHAELLAVQDAFSRNSSEFLWTCTLYTTVEPCAMCAGAIYWGNIGRLVFGISESMLLEMTGADPRNPTLSMPCRDVFSAGTKSVHVTGPVEEVQEEILELHRQFWNAK